MTAVLKKSRIASLTNWLRARLHRRFRPLSFPSREAYLEHVKRHYERYEHRRHILRELNTNATPIVTPGYCDLCQAVRNFETNPVRWKANPSDTPNWREELHCPGCHLSSRMRASVHLLRWILGDQPEARIYLTEQITPLYGQVKMRYPNSLGSEFLGDGTRPGASNSEGIRCEDLTSLTFGDESFDAVVSLEVIEHVPDFRSAFAECARVLVPGGKLVLTVPFHGGPNHLLRARIRDDGTVEHMETPEYHGDPLKNEGCLCFHHFGWDMLDFLKEAGFRRAATYATWSRELGYLAEDYDMLQFIGVK